MFGFACLKCTLCFCSVLSSFQQRLSYNTLSDLALALIDGTVYEIVQGLLDIQHLTEKNLYNQRQKLHCEHQGMWFAYRATDGSVLSVLMQIVIKNSFTVWSWNSCNTFPDWFVALKQDLLRKHKDALLTCKRHNLALLKSNQQAELEVRITGFVFPKDFALLCDFCFTNGTMLDFQMLEMRVREEQQMMDKKIVAEIDQKVLDQQNTLEKAGVPGFYVTTNPQVHVFLLQCFRNFIFRKKCHEYLLYLLTLCSCFLFQELIMQINLLELMLKLQQKESQPGLQWLQTFVQFNHQLYIYHWCL